MTKTQLKIEAIKARNETMVKVERAYIDAIDAGIEHDTALKNYQNQRHQTWVIYNQAIGKV
jgi:collagenase-like PrtC family protease